MLPYEYCVSSTKDSLTLINENFGFCLIEEELVKSVFVLCKMEKNFYKTSKDVGFSIFKCRKGFDASLFALDLEGNPDGIEEKFSLNHSEVLIVKNHPCAFLNFSSNSPVEVEVIKVKHESIISSFDTSKNKEFLEKMINQIHLKDDSIKKYTEIFYEKSILTLYNFFNVSFNFTGFESWPRAGPADYKSFKYNLKDEEINSFMKSKEFITWLSSITGLPLLHPAVPIYTRCLQAAGDYQILHGNYSESLGLDVIYNYYPVINFKEWPESNCGRIHYLNDCGDEIFQVDPINNSLTIVYRTDGCLRFTENVKGLPEIPLFQTIGIYSVAEE